MTRRPTFTSTSTAPAAASPPASRFTIRCSSFPVTSPPIASARPLRWARCCSPPAAKTNDTRLPNARIMIHQPLAGLQGTAREVEIHVEELRRIKKRMNEIMLEHTGHSLEKVEEDTDRDRFMSAEESRDYGPDRQGDQENRRRFVGVGPPFQYRLRLSRTRREPPRSPALTVGRVVAEHVPPGSAERRFDADSKSRPRGRGGSEHAPLRLVAQDAGCFCPETLVRIGQGVLRPAPPLAQQPRTRAVSARKTRGTGNLPGMA